MELIECFASSADAVARLEEMKIGAEFGIGLDHHKSLCTVISKRHGEISYKKKWSLKKGNGVYVCRREW